MEFVSPFALARSLPQVDPVILGPRGLHACVAGGCARACV